MRFLAVSLVVAAALFLPSSLSFASSNNPYLEGTPTSSRPNTGGNFDAGGASDTFNSVNINDLISGASPEVINRIAEDKATIDAQHNALIKEFKDKIQNNPNKDLSVEDLQKTLQQQIANAISSGHTQGAPVPVFGNSLPSGFSTALVQTDAERAAALIKRSDELKKQHAAKIEEIKKAAEAFKGAAGAPQTAGVPPISEQKKEEMARLLNTAGDVRNTRVHMNRDVAMIVASPGNLSGLINDIYKNYISTSLFTPAGQLGGLSDNTGVPGFDPGLVPGSQSFGGFDKCGGDPQCLPPP